MNGLGVKIRALREGTGLPLRVVANYLDLDQAILSKIERGQRKPSREQVVKLAKYFKVVENDLLVIWLSDKVVYEIEDEDMALQAMQVAEEKIKNIVRPKTSRTDTIKAIKKILQNDGRVASAWLFGSVARGEEKPGSDIDIMVELNRKKKYSMFDLLDIAFIIENKLDRKVDLVEKGLLKNFATKSASDNLMKIYG